MMTRLLILIVLVFVGFAGWKIGSNLSNDAIGMGVGMLLGIMAGLPTAMLVLASSRRDRDEPRRPYQPQPHQLTEYRVHFHADAQRAAELPRQRKERAEWTTK